MIIYKERNLQVVVYLSSCDHLQREEFTSCGVYVVVQFYPWFKFFFFCFGYGNLMIMSLKEKKKKFEPRIKLNHNIYIVM